MALTIPQFAYPAALNTQNVTVNITATLSGDQIVCFGYIGTAGAATVNSLQTNNGNTGTYQKINGSTTPGVDTGFTSNLDLNYLVYLIPSVTTGTTSVAMDLSTTPSFSLLCVWVVRGSAGALSQDIGILNNQASTTIQVSGLSGTLAQAAEVAFGFGITGATTSSIDTAQTGSAAFTSDGGSTNGDWASHQVTTVTTSIQSAFDTTLGTTDTLLFTFFDSGAASLTLNMQQRIMM